MNRLDLTLLYTGILIIGYQLFFFFIAAYFKFDKVTDFAGGSNFLIVALSTLLANNLSETTSRQLYLSIIVCLWGVRLSAFLLYRVIVFEKDNRFDGTREKPLVFLGFWIFQMLWVWIASFPIIYVNSMGISVRAEINGVDIASIVLTCTGLIIEAMADQTKFNFKLDKANSGKWCADGVWKYSRHPNYFGELTFWWGIFIGATQSYYNIDNTGFFTILSPLFITSLLFGLSGMPILEANANKRFGSNPDYIKYREETSILVPLPNSFYVNIPNIIKVVVLFEWPIYAVNLSDKTTDIFTK